MVLAVLVAVLFTLADAASGIPKRAARAAALAISALVASSASNGVFSTSGSLGAASFPEGTDSDAVACGDRGSEGYKWGGGWWR